MMLAWVVLLAGAALVVSALIGWPGHRERRDSEALAILSERLARGEISEQDFSRLRELLRR